MKKGKLKKILATSAMGIMALAMPFALTGCTQNDNINVRVDGDYIQWQVDGSDSWTNLLTIDEVKDLLGESYKGDTGEKGDQGVQGEQGLQGNPGINGKEVEFRKTETHLQWRYVDSSQEEDDNWENLIALSEMKGAPGQDGSEGNDGLTPFIGSNGNWWIGEEDTGVKAECLGGNTWVVGAESPASPNNGDMFLNNISWNVYQYNGTTWELKGNIKGVKGDKGEQGEDGTDFTEVYNITTKVNSFKTGTHTVEVGGNIFVSAMARTGDLIQVYFITKPGYQLTSYNIETEGYTPRLTILSSTTLNDGTELMMATFNMISYDVEINVVFSKIVEIPALNEQYIYSSIGQSPYEETSEYTVTGDTSKEDVGNYVSILTLNQGYVWSDGTMDPKAINWYIVKQEVDFSKLNYFAVYDGKEKTFSPIGNYSVVSGTNRATEIGTYEVVVGLKNNNYIWTDGTSGNKTITWKIVEKVIDFAKATVGSERRYYTGEEQATPYYLGYEDDGYKTIITSNEMFEVTGNTQATEIGTYDYTFTLKNPNYILSNGKNSVTFSWEIKMRTISINEVVNKFTGNDIDVAYSFVSIIHRNSVIVSGETSARDVGEYEVTLSLVDKEHSCWDDGTTEDKKVTWQIIICTLSSYASNPKTSYKYTGEEIIAFEDENYCAIWGVGRATEIGQYTVVLILKENYCWSDGSTENKVITWEIIK